MCKNRAFGKVLMQKNDERTNGAALYRIGIVSHETIYATNALRITLLLCLALILSACATPTGTKVTAAEPSFASGVMLAEPVQCVPYARQVSGIQIRGDAHSWWDQAAPGKRGPAPKPGAVLVLARTGKMTSGHVAVVKDVLGPRLINVTHSNWGNDRESRRVLYHSMRVEDISANNDWTRVRFWNAEKNCFGFPYAARGFIYG